MISAKVEILKVGFCRHIDRIVDPNGDWKVKSYPAMVALITHPTQGHIIFDAGYSSYYFNYSNKFPDNLLNFVTPVSLPKDQLLHEQLEKRGIRSKDIALFFLSHLHSDHISGCFEFPGTPIMTSKEGLDHALKQGPLRSILSGFQSNMIHALIKRNINYIEDCSSQLIIKKPFDVFGECYDVFGDGLLIAIHLPGHSKGHFGLIINSNVSAQPVFLVADACWHSNAYKKNSMPGILCQLILHDKNSYKETLRKIHYCHNKFDELIIIPSHCHTTLQQYSGCTLC